jgi:hypothetical protein
LVRNKNSDGGNDESIALAATTGFGPPESIKADRIYVDGPVHLEPAFRADWKESADDTARRRIVVDQVASLTDQSALAWFERLVVT